MISNPLCKLTPKVNKTLVIPSYKAIDLVVINKNQIWQTFLKLYFQV